MNAELVKPFTMEEIDTTIKQMAPLKASGPDGMLHPFYQTFWQHIGPEVSEAVLSCLNSGTLLKSINHTFISLIPKVNNPKVFQNLDLIVYAMCFTKLLAKLLPTALKPLLNSIVSKTQSAFIADRLITNNILIAFESLHYMKTSSSGKEGFMTLKLDMSKAYDRVEWSSLKKSS